jgi:hypothetical protein
MTAMDQDVFSELRTLVCREQRLPTLRESIDAAEVSDTENSQGT